MRLFAGSWRLCWKPLGVAKTAALLDSPGPDGGLSKTFPLPSPVTCLDYHGYIVQYYRTVFFYACQVPCEMPIGVEYGYRYLFTADYKSKRK